MHTKAEAMAVRLGTDFEDPSTALGLANVAVHRLAALVRLGDGPAALDYAQTIDAQLWGRLPRERRANYLLDLAEAHRQCGNIPEAIDALWQADLTAPQEVRNRPLGRDLIIRLKESDAASPQLRQLAAHAGIAE